MENKIYNQKTRKLRQNTQKIANFLRYYSKIHSKLPIFRVKSVKIYTGQKKLHEPRSWARDKYEVCTSQPNVSNDDDDASRRSKNIVEDKYRKIESC